MYSQFPANLHKKSDESDQTEETIDDMEEGWLKNTKKRVDQLDDIEQRIYLNYELNMVVKEAKENKNKRHKSIEPCVYQKRQIN